MFETQFTDFDWLIVFVYLIGSGILGMYVNKYIHNAEDYLVGGRNAGTALSIASFIGTGLGLVTLMYASMEGFTKGFSYLIVPLIAFVVYLVLGSTGFVIQHLRDLKLMTLPEYFELRFTRRVRVTSGLIAVLAGVLNMGLFPKMGATFITYVTGMGGEDAEFTVNMITSLLILLVLVYTVLGGMVAVLVTDYVQFVVLSVGLGLGLWYCLTDQVDHLGWNNLVSTWQVSKGDEAFNPVHASSYGWTYVIWQIVLISTAGICWAPEATRALTTKDSQTTRKTFFFGSPGFFVRMAIPGVWGITAYTFVFHHPELHDYFLSDNEAGHPAQAMPLLLGNIIPTGMLGLLVAGLLAAFMSTHDSYLLSWASIVSQDIIAPLKGVQQLSDKESIFYTRISVVLIGVFLLVWGIWYELPESVWTYMGVTGTVYLSGSATAMIGGIYWKRASSRGALWAMYGGLLAISGLFVESIQNWYSNQYGGSIAGWFNGPTVTLAVYVACIVLFIVGSVLFPDPIESEASKGGEV